MKNRITRGIAVISLALFLIIIIINIFSLFTYQYITNSYEIKKGIPGYSYPTRDIESLLRFREKPPSSPDFMWLKETNEMVFYSIVHRNRYLEFYENWLLYLMGLFYEPLKSTQDTDRLIASGSGMYGEVSQILKTIVENVG